MNNALSPFSDLTEVIVKRRRAAAMRAENASLLRSSLMTILVLAIAFFAFQQVYHFRIVHGSDMFPSLCDGDLVLCYRVKECKKNDIVCYTVNGSDYFGRVAAKGGDEVALSADGNFTVNGTNQNNEVIYPTYPVNGKGFKVHVRADELFILGDFRTEATDSRMFGCIPMEDVKDRVVVLIRHRKF